MIIVQAISKTLSPATILVVVDMFQSKNMSIDGPGGLGLNDTLI